MFAKRLANARKATGLSLRDLGAQVGLSHAAILYRARDLGIISSAYHERIMKLFSIKGWRRTEPGKAYPSEKAHIFEQNLFHALGEKYI